MCSPRTSATYAVAVLAGPDVGCHTLVSSDVCMYLFHFERYYVRLLSRYLSGPRTCSQVDVLGHRG